MLSTAGDGAYLANNSMPFADIPLIPIVFTVAMTPEGDDFGRTRPDVVRRRENDGRTRVSDRDHAALLIVKTRSSNRYQRYGSLLTR